MNLLKRIFICLLITSLICIFSGFKTYAAELSDDAYYKRVYNNDKTKVNVQYSASLLFTGQNGINARFEGYAGAESGLNDNEIKAIINDCARKNEHYNNFDNVKADIDRMDELKHKLDFTDEDYAQLAKNWLSILGLSSVTDLANGFGKVNYGTFQDLTSGEAAKTARGIETLTEVGVEYYKNGKSFKGMGMISPKNFIPSVQSIVMNTIVVSAEQYDRDVERQEDKVELSNLMMNFCGFRISCLAAIKKALKEKAVWVIKINDTYVQDVQYVPYVKTKTVFTCNLNLSKNEVSSRFGGTYTGSISIESNVKSSLFDTTYGPKWEEILNGKGKDEFTLPEAASDGVKIKFINDDYSKTDFSSKLSSNNFTLTTNSFGYGKSSGLLTQNINMTDLNLDYYNFDINHNVHLGWQNTGEKFDYYYTILGTKTMMTYNWDWYLVSGEKNIELHDSDTTGNGEDPRPFLKCVLYINVTDGGNYEWQLPNL